MEDMHKLVLIRHGQSVFNLEGRFSGWSNTPLSPAGAAEAMAAGEALRKAGYTFDMAYSSLLSRANQTLCLVLDRMDLLWIPVHKNWRLNERHWGALEGVTREEALSRYGQDEVLRWRTDYRAAPPAADEKDAWSMEQDRRYSNLIGAVPRTESMEQAWDRLLPLWSEDISRKIDQGERVLIAAHGNILRALIRHLEGLPERDAHLIETPTAIPLILELDADLRAKRTHCRLQRDI
ncbi:MAG: phosphoglyceromutase [Methanosaeta sp. PtaU1.Bin028]|nr:MAG: phosphoglyceromutase [Methanosaeta sp. PtaU1.Bin028]